MREWNLQQDQLPSIILAADVRLSRLNYYDDQVWELHLNSGEPASLSFQTTYGLRARSMRLFPRFSEGDTSRTAPDEFASSTALHRFFPNYALVSCSPFDGIDAICEYWVPRSNLAAGRIRVFNSGVTPRKIRLELVGLLVPAAEGERLAPARLDSLDVLQGQTGGLSAVVYMAGVVEARHSPYPSLGMEIDLLPGLDRTLSWVHAALPDPQASITLARDMAAADWDAEVARIEMTNASSIEIETGNPDWDLAFALGQNTAFNLLHGPTEHLPQASFVLTRLPDEGFSLRGDGSDYDHAWSGQTPLEALYLISQILPAAPDLAQGLLENFLKTQNESGQIDWRPGFTGKTSGLLATPMLATLSWRIFQTSQDREFLERALEPLHRFFSHWFEPEHDRNGDGIPEFDHVTQTGFDENPLFTPWQPWSQGADITFFESPALNALLYLEAQSLQEIARLLGRTEPIASLATASKQLKSAIQRAWDDESSTYIYLDRDTHHSPAGETLANHLGPGVISLQDSTFEHPVRLSVRIHQTGERGREPQLVIHGIGSDHHPLSETLAPTAFRWALGIGTAVSGQVYRSLSRIELEGIRIEDQVIVQTVDFRHHDQTLFLPLWAGIPEQGQAEAMIRNHLMRPTRYWQSYGLSACAVSQCPDPAAAPIYETAWMPWNSLMGAGLVQYGYRELAAELVSRLMDSVVRNMRAQGGFPKNHHAKTGRGTGDRNALTGLPPLSLFLETLGVDLFSPWKVGLNGRNPFPWPVRIRHRGLVIDRDQQATEITFPDGQTVHVDQPETCIIDSRPAKPKRNH